MSINQNSEYEDVEENAPSTSKDESTENVAEEHELQTETLPSESKNDESGDLNNNDDEDAEKRSEVGELIADIFGDSDEEATEPTVSVNVINFLC